MIFNPIETRVITNAIFGTSGVDSSFSPSDIDGAIMAPNIANLPRSQWNSSGYQINNLVDPLNNLKLRSGGGISFDSLNEDCIDCQFSESLNTSQPISFYAWIKKTSSTDSFIIGQQDGSSNNFKGIAFQVRNDNVLRFIIRLDASNIINVETVTTLSNDNWYHVAVTYDGSLSANGVNIYINGVIEAKSIINDNIGLSSDISTNSNMAVGVQDISGSKGAFFDGTIKDVGYFLSELSDIEVNYIFENANILPISKLHYSFAEGSILNNSIVLDYSGNGNHGIFSTVAAGSYDAAVNDSEEGLQSSLHSFSLYKRFLEGQANFTSPLYLSGDFDISLSLIPNDNDLSSGINPWILQGSGFELRIYDGRLRFGYLGTPSISFKSYNVFSLGPDKLYNIRCIKSGDNLTVTCEESSFDQTLSWITPDGITINRVSNTNGSFEGVFISFSLDESLKIYGHNFKDTIGSNDAIVDGTFGVTRVLSINPSSDTDFFGSPTEYSWVEGVFNFNGSQIFNSPHYGLISELELDLDESALFMCSDHNKNGNINIGRMLFNYPDYSVNTGVFSNGSQDFLNFSNFFDSGVRTVSVIDGKFNTVFLEIDSVNTSVSCNDIDSDISVSFSDLKNSAITGTSDLLIGNQLNEDSRAFDGYITGFLIADTFTNKDKQDLKEYAKIKINQL